MCAARKYLTPIYALCMGDSMAFWKKLYFVLAVIGAAFLIVSLF